MLRGYYRGNAKLAPMSAIGASPQWPVVAGSTPNPTDPESSHPIGVLASDSYEALWLTGSMRPETLTLALRRRGLNFAQFGHWGAATPNNRTVARNYQA